VRVTAASAGTLELLALVVYTAVDGTPGATRLVHSADVRRLITVSSEIVPARSGYLVSVQVTSLADAPITIGNLTPVSQFWEAESSAGAVLYPNQVFRGVIVAKAASSPAAALDLRQTGLVSSLAAVLRGQLDSLSPITPMHVSMLSAVPEGYFIQRRTHRLKFAASNFSALASDLVPKVLPMFDPLDLDIVFDWTIGNPATEGARFGHGGALGMHPAPGFSLVEDLRAENDGPAKRTMYEETDRIRKKLADSVLDGVYAAEQDPVVVRARVQGTKAGTVKHDFSQG
jgi:hypothetical protein